MKELFKKTLNAASRFFEIFIIDDETARRISERYIEMYHIRSYMR